MGNTSPHENDLSSRRPTACRRKKTSIYTLIRSPVTGVIVDSLLVGLVGAAEIPGL